MNHNRLARLAALAAAGLTGLGLCGWCLGASAASAAPPANAAAAQTWFVDNTPGEGLAGYWKFDQVFDGNTFNSAFLSEVTSLNNGAFITASIPPTVSIPNFGSLQLDGLNVDVVAGDVPKLDVSPSSFSVAAWVRRVYTGTHTADLIYDSGTQSGHWFFGFLNNDKLALTVNAVKDYTSTLSVADSNWHHVAAVVSGSGAGNLVLYLDGVPSSAISAVITTTPGGNKRIGNKNGSLNTPFGGNIEELRLYNRPLNAVEVGRLATGRGCVTDGSSWPTAFGDLQCALVAAHGGDQIWIANGTYRPGTDSHASFSLVQGTSVLGGFLGTETSPAQRPPFNPLAVPTALSGDLAGDDQTLTFGNYSENACNVVKAGNPGIPGSVSATMDGLAIQAGNAEAGAGCGIFPSAPRGGGLWAIGPSILSLNDVVFRFNRASESGGGLSNDFGQLSITGGLFFSNTAASNSGFPIGGGLAVQGGNVTITASSFVSNTASQGGAIDLRPGQGHTTLAVSGGSFTSNQAQDGGAVEDQVFDGLLDLSFDNVHFTSNQATGGDGGAVSNTALDPGVVRTHVSQSTFTGNIAEEDGGAISDFGGQLTIDGSELTSNAGQVGAGGALEARSVVTVTNSTFQSNSAHSGGAASVLGTLILSGSSVILNQGQDPGLGSNFTPIGGGVFVSGTALITNTEFLTNTAFLQGVLMDVNLAGGGGLAVTGNLALTGSQFLGNSARQGGGLQVIGSATVQNSLFQGNTAGEGGGVFADGNLVLVTNQLIDNTASLADSTNQPGRGGGVFLQNGGFGGRINNNLFRGNQALSISTAPSGAAMALGGLATLVSNNTIVSHNLITASAASLVTGTAGLFNNIIVSHTLALENQGGFNLFEDYNLFHANTITASGVISSLGHSRQADPRFVALALDDFRLRLDSPAVDAGDNSRVPGIVTTDLSGGPRFVDMPSVPDTGAGSAPIVDIGAYEVNARLFLPVVKK